MKWKNQKKQKSGKRIPYKDTKFEAQPFRKNHIATTQKQHNKVGK